ncbi:MAG: hypothetical protein WC130_05155 [Kiritimatiellia bacterium]
METQKNDIDTLGCSICLKKFPGKKFWQLSKVKMELLGGSVEAQICPECQKKMHAGGFHVTHVLLEKTWKNFRAELQKLAGVSE